VTLGSRSSLSLLEIGSLVLEARDAARWILALDGQALDPPGRIAASRREGARGSPLRLSEGSSGTVLSKTEQTSTPIMNHESKLTRKTQ
jgi:hypothetical protein